MLEVLSIVPDGPPLRFRYRGEDHRVARFWGPERIETGWWRHRPVWRDYYRVETNAGAWFWLFQRRDDGRWRLHGEYG
jgi:protein ImuB